MIRNNPRQPSGNYPIYDFKKAMFLVATGNKPVSITLEDGRTRFVFHANSRKYVRFWHELNDTVMNASQSGIPMTPDEVDDLQSSLWEILESGEVAQ